MPRFNPYKRFHGIFIPNGVYDHESLNPTSKLIYGRLLRYAGKDGVCRPKQTTLAKELSISPTTVKTSIKQLETQNLIEIEKGNTIKHEPNEYFFLEHECLGIEPSKKKLSGEPEIGSPGGAENDYPLKDEESQFKENKNIYKNDSEKLKPFEKTNILCALIKMVNSRYQMDVGADFIWQNKTRASIEKLLAQGITDKRILVVLEWLEDPGNEFEYTLDSGGRVAGNFIAIEEKMKSGKSYTVAADLAKREKHRKNMEDNHKFTRQYVDRWEKANEKPWPFPDKILED